MLLTESVFFSSNTIQKIKNYPTDVKRKKWEVINEHVLIETEVKKYLSNFIQNSILFTNLPTKN